MFSSRGRLLEIILWRNLVVFGISSVVPYNQRLQVQGIGVVADDSLHWSGGLAVLTLVDLGLAFLGVAVEDDGGSPYQVIFEELVQVFGVKTGEV